MAGNPRAGWVAVTAAPFAIDTTWPQPTTQVIEHGRPPAPGRTSAPGSGTRRHARARQRRRVVVGRITAPAFMASARHHHLARVDAGLRERAAEHLPSPAADAGCPETARQTPRGPGCRGSCTYCRDGLWRVEHRRLSSCCAIERRAISITAANSACLAGPRLPDLPQQRRWRAAGRRSRRSRPSTAPGQLPHPPLMPVRQQQGQQLGVGQAGHAPWASSSRGGRRRAVLIDMAAGGRCGAGQGSSGRWASCRVPSRPEWPGRQEAVRRIARSLVARSGAIHSIGVNTIQEGRS